MGSRGSGNRASASLPLKASLCGSFSAATRKKCVARARAHLVQEREIDLQVVKLKKMHSKLLGHELEAEGLGNATKSAVRVMADGFIC